jgi:mannose-1-phosphate guanylyltransferase
MNTRYATWAIVLAAGDGARLSALTTDERGDNVPKQFCSLNGGPSLLQKALQRALCIVPRERVCAIVARRHERHWQHAFSSLPARNVIVQPRNCGTAIGVLLGLLRILERDPLARVVFLPSDHYVQHDALFADSVRAAALPSARGSDNVTLAGIEPDNVDPELGYILPEGPVHSGLRRVTRFVEKPTATVARHLIGRGAVWNTFIFWARAMTLLTLIRRRLPEVVDVMADALARDWRRDHGTVALAEVYERLPSVDFSRSVVQGAESELRVSTLPACGWTDLGTPGRVVQALQRLRSTSAIWSSDAPVGLSAPVVLASRVEAFAPAKHQYAERMQ